MVKKLSDLRILVIDDDNVMCTYVQGLLKRLGVEQVQEGVDGQSGLAMVAEFRPDIVVTDIHMAPMNGLDFVHKLRRHPVADIR
jgi:CheY-like chemotaxis protein